MQSMISAAESIGLGICPISMIRNIIDEVKIICDLPKGVFPIAGLSLGCLKKNQKFLIGCLKMWLFIITLIMMKIYLIRSKNMMKGF